MAPVRRVLGLLAALGSVVRPALGISRMPVRDFLGSNFGVAGRNASFDYVIVGGGNAGLTLATRLAEQQQGSVAVIEAGGFYEVDNGNVSQVPAYDGTYTGKGVDDWQPLIDWGYSTVPQAVSRPRAKRLVELI